MDYKAAYDEIKTALSNAAETSSNVKEAFSNTDAINFTRKAALDKVIKPELDSLYEILFSLNTCLARIAKALAQDSEKFYFDEKSIEYAQNTFSTVKEKFGKDIEAKLMGEFYVKVAKNAAVVQHLI